MHYRTPVPTGPRCHCRHRHNKETPELNTLSPNVIYPLNIRGNTAGYSPKLIIYTLGPRVPRRYRHDCPLAGLRSYNQMVPESEEAIMSREKQNVEAVDAIAGDRRAD